MRATLLILLFLFSIFRQSFSQEGFVIDQYDITINLDQAGFFDVNERIKVTFSEERRGIFREIPTSYRVEGKEKRIDLSNIEVLEDPFKVQHSRAETVIRIGDPDQYIRGEKTYEIRYRVFDAFLFDSAGAEFYWNYIGMDWKVPIASAHLELIVPNVASSYLENFQAYAGSMGSQSQEKIISNLQENKISIETTEPLRPGEGVTMAVKYPPGVIEKYERPKVIDRYYLIPAVFFALLFGFWSRKGKQESLIVDDLMTYPPEGLSASEVGALVDDRINDRDIIALIPEWGAMGYIKVKAVEQEYGHKSDDLYIEKLNDLPQDAPLYQSTFFSALFENSDFAFLSDFKYKFTSTWLQIKKELTSLMRRPEFYDMSYHGLFHRGGMIAIFIASLVVGVVFMAALKLFITGIITVGIGILALYIHFSTPRKTRVGAELQAKLKSFRQFLREMPSDQVQQLVDNDPHYFENMLPFAVAFGLDKSFTKQFSQYRDQSPFWFYNEHSYESGKPTSMRHFRDAFVLHTVTSAFTAVQPTKTGSTTGAGGGGFSGGGFGGGGGGSW